MKKKLAYILISFCFLISFSYSQEPSIQRYSDTEQEASKKPEEKHLADKKKVIVGIFLSSITNFDLSKRTVDVSFYIWWRCTDPTYDPVNHTEIVNSPEYKKLWSQSAKIGNEYLTLGRYFSQIRNNWDVSDFPFDRQEITISMEDVGYDINSLQFIPDEMHSGISRRLRLGGWAIKSMKLTHNPHLYNTNFGDPTINDSVYSRISMVIELKRLGGRIFFNYFVGFFLAAFLCAMTFLIETSNLIARSNLTVAAIFVSVGNKYILDQSLPLTSVFGLSDAIQAATFLLITITVLTNVCCNYFHKVDRSQKALVLNKILGTLMVCGYILYLGYKIFHAVRA